MKTLQRSLLGLVLIKEIITMLFIFIVSVMGTIIEINPTFDEVLTMFAYYGILTGIIILLVLRRIVIYQKSKKGGIKG